MNTKYSRPEGFEKERSDCTVRALSLVSNIPYEEVHNAFKETGRKNGHKFKVEKFLHRICKILKLKAKQIKRSGSVSKLAQENKMGKIFCTKSGHAFALIDGVTHDLDTRGSHIKGAWVITKEVSE